MPHLHWGPLHKYLVGLPCLHFSKTEDKKKMCVAGAVPRPVFALASLLSVLSLALTSSRLSRLCLGDLKNPWLGWPTCWLAGWLASLIRGLLDSVGFLGARRLSVRWLALILTCGPCGQVALQGLQIQFLLARS